MIHINDPEYSAFLADGAKMVFNPYADQSIARTENHKLLGGVIYSDFTGQSIAIHMAGFVPHWINKDLLWVAFDYPFNQLNVKYLFCSVRGRNKKSLEICRKIGFSEVARLDGMYYNEPVIILRMAREDCKWLALGPRKIKVV